MAVFVLILQSPTALAADASSSERLAISSLEAISSCDYYGQTANCYGSPYLLMTTIGNNSSALQSFIAILEVRDGDGVTQFLEFQKGALAPNATTDIGISWQPTSEGKYEIRSFVINDLIRPDVLSKVRYTVFEVS